MIVAGVLRYFSIGTTVGIGLIDIIKVSINSKRLLSPQENECTTN